MSTAILCVAVGVCDVMTKAGMCDTKVYYVISQLLWLLLLFIVKERVNMSAP